MGKVKDVSVVAHTRAIPKRKGKAKAKPKAKPKPKGKQPVRGPEPPRKPRRRADSSRAPVKSNFKAERAITGDENYGAPIYGKGVSILDGAMRQFRQAGYHRGL